MARGEPEGASAPHAPKLEKLSIFQRFTRASFSLSATEIETVLTSPAPLRRVATSTELVERWSKPDQQRVFDQAARRGVASVKL